MPCTGHMGRWEKGDEKTGRNTRASKGTSANGNGNADPARMPHTPTPSPHTCGRKESRGARSSRPNLDLVPSPPPPLVPSPPPPLDPSRPLPLLPPSFPLPSPTCPLPSPLSADFAHPRWRRVRRPPPAAQRPAQRPHASLAPTPSRPLHGDKHKRVAPRRSQQHPNTIRTQTNPERHAENARWAQPRCGRGRGSAQGSRRPTLRRTRGGGPATRIAERSRSAPSRAKTAAQASHTHQVE